MLRVGIYFFVLFALFVEIADSSTNFVRASAPSENGLQAVWDTDFENYDDQCNLNESKKKDPHPFHADESHQDSNVCYSTLITPFVFQFHFPTDETRSTPDKFPNTRDLSSIFRPPIQA